MHAAHLIEYFKTKVLKQRDLLNSVKKELGYALDSLSLPHDFILIRSVKDLQKRVTELETENTRLRQHISEVSSGSTRNKRRPTTSSSWRQTSPNRPLSSSNRLSLPADAVSPRRPLTSTLPQLQSTVKQFMSRPDTFINRPDTSASISAARPRTQSHHLGPNPSRHSTPATPRRSRHGSISMHYNHIPDTSTSPWMQRLRPKSSKGPMPFAFQFKSAHD
jgi:hypothetical protein